MRLTELGRPAAQAARARLAPGALARAQVAAPPQRRAPAAIDAGAPGPTSAAAAASAEAAPVLPPVNGSAASRSAAEAAARGPAAAIEAAAAGGLATAPRGPRAAAAAAAEAAQAAPAVAADGAAFAGAGFLAADADAARPAAAADGGADSAAGGGILGSLGSIDIDSVSQGPPAAEPSAAAIFAAAIGRRPRRRRGPWHSRQPGAGAAPGLLPPKGRAGGGQRQGPAGDGAVGLSAEQWVVPLRPSSVASSGSSSSSAALPTAAPEPWQDHAGQQQQHQQEQERQQEQVGANLGWEEEEFEFLDREARTRTGAQASTSSSGSNSGGSSGFSSGPPPPAATESDAFADAPLPPPPFNRRDRGFECRVTREASAAPDWFVLRRVFERWQGRLNAIQLAAMVCRLAELAASTHARMLRSELGAFRRFSGALLLEARGALPAADAGTVAAMLSGLARLKAAGKWPEADQVFISDALFYATPTLGALEPSQLGNLLWALARLGHAPGGGWLAALFERCEALLPRLSRDEVPLVMYALARLQATPPPRWRAALSDAAAAELPSLRQPQLAMLLHALGAGRSRGSGAAAAAASDRGIGGGGSGLLEAVLEEIGTRFDRLGPQALTTCAWALARLQYVPPRSWLAGFLAASFRLLPSYRTHELAVTLWALSALRLYPGDAWLDEFFDTSEALLDFGTPRRSSSSAAAAAAAAASESESEGEGEDAELSPAAAAAAAKAQAQAQAQAAAAAAAQAAGQCFSPLDLAMTGYALARLGLRPPKSWARRYCGAVLRHKRSLTKPLLRQVLVALSSFRIGNLDGWRAELYAASGLRLTRRLRGRRGVKRSAREAQEAQLEALQQWTQQAQEAQQWPLGQWRPGVPTAPPPLTPEGARIRLILDARRMRRGGGGSGSDSEAESEEAAARSAWGGRGSDSDGGSGSGSDGSRW